MSASPATPARLGHRAGVVRRALRREGARLRDPRRILAMALLIGFLALVLAGIVARADTGGSDAQAYWAAVRLWLEGGDPYHPTGPFLPYVYAPWMLPLFVPWALLPWDVAWFAWRGATLLVFLWSVRWAYGRRPLPTAVLIVILAIPIGASIDTGNINLPLAVALFGAQFTRGWIGGLIWGLATSMKWVPAPLWVVLPPRARRWGLVFLAISGLLSLLMLPLTIVQLQALFGFGHRPFRADYLVFVWAIVPWWWRLRRPFAFLQPAAWLATGNTLATRTRRWTAAFRADPRTTFRRARDLARAWASRFLGLDGRGDAGDGRLPARPRASEIGD
ncbi:MAG: glycosyltransferase 87 family protein [Chloroflexota bacterium]